MKKITLLLFLAAHVLVSRSQTAETFHDFTGMDISGDSIAFSDYAGKKVLVVNTASFCAYTPQFADLVTLDSLYGGPGFAIIGFPCNDFGGQDPGDDSTIYGFCTNYYGVDFMMMSKVSITAPDTVEVYKWLQLQSRNGVADAPVTWNFHKFCIDELGHWVMHFPSVVNPLDTAIINWINSPSAVGLIQPQTGIPCRLSGNPCREKIILSLNTRSPIPVEISLSDMQGRIFSILKSKTVAGTNQFDLPAEHLDPGIYFLTISNSEYSATLKVLKAE